MGGRPSSAEPGYKRQLKANAFVWEDSGQRRAFQSNSRHAEVEDWKKDE
jgi:hypothetical protein